MTKRNVAWIFILAFIIGSFSLRSVAAEEKTFTFCYDPYPPFAFGEFDQFSRSGLKVQALEDLGKTTGLQFKVILMPLARCLTEVTNGTLDGTLPIFKTDQREKNLIFTKPAFVQETALFYRKKDFPQGLHWKEWKELTHLKLGILLGTYVDKKMEDSFSGKNNLHYANNLKSLFTQLNEKRVDLVAIDRKVGDWNILKANFSGSLTGSNQNIGEQEAYYAISKKSPLAQKLDLINGAIQSRVKKATTTPSRPLPHPDNL